MTARKKGRLSKGGRPTIWRKEYIEICQRLAQGGATISEMARVIGVSQQLLSSWIWKKPELKYSIKLGRLEPDENVTRALYERAVGYDQEVERVGFYKGRAVRAKTVEHIPADVGAALSWLYNRQPREWRQRQELDARVTVETDGPTNRDLAKALALLMAEARLQRLQIDGTVTPRDGSGGSNGTGGTNGSGSA
jgi:hypothetical protein